MSNIEDLFSDLEKPKKQEAITPPPTQVNPKLPKIPEPTVPFNQADLFGASSKPKQTPTPIPVKAEPIPILNTPPAPLPVKPVETPKPKLEDVFSQPTTPTAPKVESLFTTEPPIEQPKPQRILNTPTSKHKEELNIPSEFDLTPATGQLTKIYMIYGNKGHGKTSLALSFNGKIAAISFDRKTTEVWTSMFGESDRITIYDGLRYMDWSSAEKWLESSKISLEYVNAILREIRQKGADWIFIDGSGDYIKMCEHTMRYNNNFSITDGVRWEFWKERSLFIKNLHMQAMGIAKKGMIYGAYIDTKEIKKDDRITDVEEHPKWVDIIEDETDVVIRVKSRLEGDRLKFYAFVESSKWQPIKTGITVDVTLRTPDQDPDGFDRLLQASR